MATAIPQDFVKTRHVSARAGSHPLRQVLAIAGSLKITCALFVFGMFIIFVGSLAQSRRDVWQVVNQYFRVYVAEVEMRDFFPPSMFPQFLDTDWEETLGVFASFPFPGGWTIGWLLFINLLAAHASRIRIQARGSRLLAGVGCIVVGVGLMTMVVISGNQQTGVEQGNTLLRPGQIWTVLLGVLGIAAIAAAVAVFTSSKSNAEKYVLTGIATAAAALLIWFAVSGPVNLSSMRILWQLLKGCVCAFVLLIGCQLLFKKRGGIVLLHSGVAILMISELVVGLYGHESLMTIVEGESTSFARDIREVELAVISHGEKTDHVVVVPESLLLASERAGRDGDESQASDAVISLEVSNIPFDLKVRRFIRNCQMRSAEPDDELTESGMGSFAVPVELDPVDGMNDETDMSAAYVELINRATGSPIQTVLVSHDASESRGTVLPERVECGGRSWDLMLRFRRNYRPYAVELIDVRRDTYVGSSTPKSFQSTLRIANSKTNDDSTHTIWMNNPLRYNGETFYQSGYHPLPSGKEASTLQLVRNSGWMLPYIGCVVVAFGMFGQFWITLRRFLVRASAMTVSSVIPDDQFTVPSSGREPMVQTADTVDPGLASTGRSRLTTAFWIPAVVVVLCVAWLGSQTRAPRPRQQTMNLYEFAGLPIAASGRTQPIDSFARSELLLISHKSTFYGELTQSELDEREKHKELLKAIRKCWKDVNFDSLESFSGDYEDWITEIEKLTSSGKEAVEERIRDQLTAKMSAIRWLLDMVAQPQRAGRHRVIRIDNDQILDALGLEPRMQDDAKLRYSLLEIQPKLSSLEYIDQDARRQLEANQDNRLTVLQRRVMDLFNTIRRLDSMQQVFQVSRPDDLLPLLVEVWRIFRALEGAPAPMGIATGIDDEQRAWETIRAATLLHGCREQLAARGLRDRKGLEAWFVVGLPREALTKAVERNYELLVRYAVEKAGDELPSENAANMLAAQLMKAVDDRFDREVYAIIAAADLSAPVSTAVTALNEERLQEIAGEKITRDLFEVFTTLEHSASDDRLADMRRRVRAMAPDSDATAGQAINRELFSILLDDLGKRTETQEIPGRLLYPGSEASVFTASVKGMAGALNAWRADDVSAFNESVSEYKSFLVAHEVSQVAPSRVSLETSFNRFDPFGKAIYLYLPAILLSFASWIVWPRILRRTAFSMIVVGLVVHSAALWARMEISGRPPVTSLYSSAIFIGWAMVAASLVIERIVGFGIGNIVGASVGSATLMIAHYLARDEGDTFSVMQAVLDTTFWLATHVVCITLGYGATFLAGALGLCYVVQSYLANNTSSRIVVSENLAFLGKVVYGVLCFALFFSLVGTVLGGLWADDSWGRFWGWDPKENGALIIVLWNALILHVRRDKMVRDYGTAVLAMAGNIVTAWSWFGVNELRSGLHSYGFTEGRLAMLAAFIGVQLVIIAVAIALRPQKTQMQS